MKAQLNIDAISDATGFTPDELRERYGTSPPPASVVAQIVNDLELPIQVVLTVT